MGNQGRPGTTSDRAGADRIHADSQPQKPVTSGGRRAVRAADSGDRPGAEFLPSRPSPNPAGLFTEEGH